MSLEKHLFLIPNSEKVSKEFSKVMRVLGYYNEEPPNETLRLFNSGEITQLAVTPKQIGSGIRLEGNIVPVFVWNAPEDFKEQVKMKITPKIKGYDFRNGIVQDFCSKMFDGYDFDEHIDRNGVHIMAHSYMIKALRMLGVLDTWCHPVNTNE